MARRRVLVLAVTLLAAGAFLRPAAAAEPSGPSTPAVPGACSDAAPLLAAPAMLTPAPLPDALPIQQCGCGASVCMGWNAGTTCGTGLTCVAEGHCIDSPAFWRCGCVG